MKDKILFVGGNWDLDGGKASKIVNEFAKNLDNVTLYNGGNYNDLNQIIDTVKDYNIVFWWANVDNSLPKIRNVKTINPKVMLISSKRNDNDKYQFSEIMQKSFELKSNLTVIFKKENNLYQMTVLDPLGNVWYEGNSIDKCAKSLLERLNFIKNITRQSTISDNENHGDLKWLFDIFKGESNPDFAMLNKNEFIQIIREFANEFTEKIFDSKDVKRFLGNASFRCPKGFPSFREGDYIFVSKRNINKLYIQIDDFVPVYMKDDKLYYCGENKPSVDTPVQVRLYNKLPNINYMIHSHCYLENAPFNENALPCGAIEEVNEILDCINRNYNQDFDRDFYQVNLKGHGSIVMSKDCEQLKKVKVKKRALPERMY